MSIEIRKHIPHVHIANESRFYTPTEEEIKVNEVAVKFNDLVEEVLSSTFDKASVRIIAEVVDSINKASIEEKPELIAEATSLITK